MAMGQAHRLLFFGDLHDSFEHCLPIVEQFKPEAIILLGDIQATRPLNQELREVMRLTQIWWIPGNHDTDSQEVYEHLFQGPFANRNLHGRVVKIAGYRVAGLGGVFRGKVWYPQHGNWNFFSRKELMRHISADPAQKAIVGLRHRSSIFPEDYMRLSRRRADILVTHEAPSCNRYGFHVLDRLARRMGVEVLFHGHHHDCFNYRPHFGQLGFAAYSVGLRGVAGINGEMLRPGEEDGCMGDSFVRSPYQVRHVQK